MMLVRWVSEVLVAIPRAEATSFVRFAFGKKLEDLALTHGEPIAHHSAGSVTLLPRLARNISVTLEVKNGLWWLNASTA